MQRILGTKRISPVGLGCMGMSEFYGPVNDEESLRTLNAAYELGYRHFDTADMYGRGHNESLVGTFLKRLGKRRDDILLATKVGIRRDNNDKYKIAIDGSRDYIRRACDASLQRLGLEHIDLYYLHRRDPAVPIEESVSALADLVKEGKIGAIGLCEVSVETLEAAMHVHPIAAVQSEYSLWTRDPEADMLPVCHQHGVAFVAYSPMGRGFLTGAISKESMHNASPELDFRAVLPRFNDGNIDRNLQLVAYMTDIARSLQVRPSQLALSWILSKHGHVHVIPGTKRTAYLTENRLSADRPLVPSVIAELDRLFDKDAVSGDRYPSAILQKSQQ